VDNLPSVPPFLSIPDARSRGRRSGGNYWRCEMAENRENPEPLRAGIGIEEAALPAVLM
jgi:hypothetical protein